MKHFVGSKGAEGIAQWLINEMPLHKVYCEPFLGRGVVFKTKLPAPVNIGIEADEKVIAQFWRRRPPEPKLTLIAGNAFTVLPLLKVNRDWLIYADPPYLLETRSCKRRYYGVEMFSVQEHESLLSILEAMDCNVMLSGYPSPLYAARLANWRVIKKGTTNRGRSAVEEVCWCNFKYPERLHDVRFIGANFTERQSKKRKVERWQNKFEKLTSDEQRAISLALSSVNESVADCDGDRKLTDGAGLSQKQLWDAD